MWEGGGADDTSADMLPLVMPTGRHLGGYAAIYYAHRTHHQLTAARQGSHGGEREKTAEKLAREVFFLYLCTP